MGDFGLPFFEHETKVQFADNWSKSVGRHSIKFGADISKFFGIRSDTSGRGAFDFGQNITADADVAGSGLGMASFLLGLPSNYRRRVTLVQPQEKQWKLGFYGQDTWQVTPKFTLLLGLRWDYASPIFSPKGESVGNLDLNTGNVLLSNLFDKYAGVRTPKDEFSPRLGLSYQLASNTVLRAGFGRSYFLNPYGATFGTQGCCWPIKQDQSFPQANPFTPLAFTIDQGPGAPAALPPFPESGEVPLPDGFSQIFPGVGTLPHSYSDMWNFTVQQKLPYNISMNIGYVGNVGRKLWFNDDVNTPVPGPGDFNPRRPYFDQFGWTQSLTLRNNRLNSNYQALQARVEKRFGDGFWLLSNFTWARSMDDGTFGVQNLFDIASNYGPSDFVRPRVWISSFNWDLPFGNKLQGVGKALLGGWGISGIVNLESGFYFTPTADNNSSLNSPITLRPDRNGSGKVDNPNRNQWFDPTAFSQPAAFTYGNSGRNILSGPGFASTDLSIAKSFAFSERSKLELRWDIFNAFNRTNLSNPNSSIAFDGAGNVTNLNTVGHITGITDFMRRMQIGARFSF